MLENGIIIILNLVLLFWSQFLSFFNGMVVKEQIITFFSSC